MSRAGAERPSGGASAPLQAPLGRPACGKLSRQFRLDPDPADNTVVEAPIEEFWRAIRLDLFWHFPWLPVRDTGNHRLGRTISHQHGVERRSDGRRRPQLLHRREGWHRSDHQAII